MNYPKTYTQWSNFTACGRSSTQEFPYVFVETESFFTMFKIPPLMAVLSRMSPVYTLLPCLLNIQFNVILFSVFQNVCSLEINFRVNFMSLVCYMSRP